MRFAGQTALITGAASGIGRATASRLAAEGCARLVLVDANAAALDAFDPGVPAPRNAGDVACDATWAIDFGTIDLVVVNAGVAGAAPIADLDLAEWRRILAVNLDGAFLTLRAAMRSIRDGGAIVVMASIAGVKAEAGTAAYAASKAGAIQLARVAAKEGAARGIRVNAIAPGGVETPIWQGVPMFAEIAARDGDGAAYAAFASHTPLGRWAKPEEIAGHVAHLLSTDAASMTGALVTVDGGYSL